MLPDDAAPVTTLRVYELDLLASPTCGWRLYDCTSPSAYRLDFFAEDCSFFLCRQHMEETGAILGIQPEE